MPKSKGRTYLEDMTAQFWYQVGAVLMAWYMMIEAVIHNAR